MSVMDKVLLGLGSVVVLFLWFEGYEDAADAAPVRSESAANMLAAPRAILSAGGPPVRWPVCRSPRVSVSIRQRACSWALSPRIFRVSSR